MKPYTVDKDFERLDHIARDLFGSERNGAVEALLAANPGLADLGMVLPRGTIIQVPTLAVRMVDPAYVRPWE